MLKISLSDYIQTGEGANAKSYDCLSDPDMMLKLYHKDFDTESVIQEHEMSEKIYQLGIPSPKPGQLVTDGERIGILFRRIKGKRSYSRSVSQEPERMPEYVHEFAEYAKKIHAIECPEGMFPDVKKDYLKLTEISNCLSSAEKEKVKNFIINTIPNCNTILHGDLHLGNLLTTLPQGAPMSTPHDVYYIDLGFAAYGCPLIDLGMTFSVCNWANDEFLIHDMHYDSVMSKAIWPHFAKTYFFGPEQLGEKWFGKGATMETVFEGMKPYGLLKLLLVEYTCGGVMPPHYEIISHEIVGNL